MSSWRGRKVGKGLLVGWGLEPLRFKVLHIDFAGPLSKSKSGSSYVFSMVDRATGWVEMVAAPDHTTRSAVRSILSVWIPRYGVPKTIVSDNGIHFTSKEFGEACMCGVQDPHSNDGTLSP